MNQNRHLVLLPALLLCACTTHDFSRGIYEGVRQHNESLKPVPPDPTAPRAPGYEDYERERRALAKPPAGQN